MSTELDEDIFSCILSFVFDSRTIYKILNAIPITNPFFSIALNRLCQLPIYLSSEEKSIAGSLDILDRLLSPSDDANLNSLTRTPADEIVNAIRHLIVILLSESAPLLYERLAKLLPKAQNLRILDWNGSEVIPSLDDFNTLRTLEQLKTFRLHSSEDETKGM